MMKQLSQSPTDEAFVQDPYAFYERARALNETLFVWDEYEMAATVSYEATSAILRDRRFGREPPKGLLPDPPQHQAKFWAVEDHSLLQLEGERHRRLRKLVLHAFTSRRIASLAPEIEQLCHLLIDEFPSGKFDLLSQYATSLPIIVISRLLGVPESHGDALLDWSHAMVGMYQAGRTQEMEEEAARAASEFSDFLRTFVDHKRTNPGDDLITELILAEEDGRKLTADELISTCILLLNAGHEATVHTLGNGVKALIGFEARQEAIRAENIDRCVEEVMRFDSPLHLFDRYAYEDVEIDGHLIAKTQRVACLLGAANRDPSRWDRADQFDPFRPIQTNAALGAGAHFCIGAPLARLELKAGLKILFERLPDLHLAETPRYAQNYHFHGLETLFVSTN